MNNSDDTMSAEQHFNTARMLNSQGRLAEAERHYRAVFRTHRDHPAVLYQLALICAAGGRFEEAAGLFERTVAIIPEDATLRSNLGGVLNSLGRHSDALIHLEKAIALRPDYAEAYANLGSALVELKRDKAAYAAYIRATTLNPRLSGLSNNIGYICLMHGRYEEAVTWYKKAVAQQPDMAMARAGLGNALSALGRTVEAHGVLENALALDPNNAAAQFGLGSVMEQLGRLEDARRAYERAVALASDFPAYHRALAGIRRFTENDPRLAALEGLTRDDASFPDDQRVELHFALAKAYDDLKRYASAFEHLQKGNAIKRGLVDYDEVKELTAMRDMVDAFAPELFKARRGAGDPSEVPVFIVGMPRSGTTLVEQILASHPNVFGAGEPMYLFELVAGGHAGAGFPSDIASLSDEALRRLGGLYAARVRALAPRAKRIVDKLPANFRLVGLIRLALPNARIVHIGRDPADTCFSCYSKVFSRGLEFTYELGELGRYYKAYETLMAHWRAVLPAETMLEVRYEALVEDLEAEARRIVTYCGLEWDERCLKFHETERSVHTASAVQVRSPIYNSSVGRWRPYQDHLRPLLDAIGAGSG
jgi:tetratricopeptide (TPR) repeat protein